jgi:hypothetical protein
VAAGRYRRAKKHHITLINVTISNFKPNQFIEENCQTQTQRGKKNPTQVKFIYRTDKIPRPFPSTKNSFGKINK